ncbi:hypothetical protein D2V17_00375 [Aurantiacibacter xanthus]|uniref:Uncharacterized protein n=1 Tax=Aurantiacibacter xanthus TaxID=1784712 RepID=A0A3A1PK97_9SPHN|nr:hypothetical protein [Aurantiacibacter xanthus]RIV93452.1 hypothetical protein D2V17_00375 [Aurantiacibacter xanthus]
MSRVREPVTARLPALLALALPVLAGLAYMASFGASSAYLAITTAALVVALALVAAVPQGLTAAKTRRIAAIVCAALLLVPLVTGPHMNGIARWLPLGPVTLNSGLLVLPLLARLSAQDQDYGHWMLAAALLAALLQPDAAATFAVTIAAVGLHHVTKDWRAGVVAILGFGATIYAGLNGELPPVPFVERVLVQAAGDSGPFALLLFVALMTSFMLMLFAGPGTRAERFALAGSLFGFAVMAAVNNYPTPLIGYGAAPIIGYAVALAWPEGARR